MLTTSCCISRITRNFKYFEYFKEKTLIDRLEYMDELQYYFDKFNIIKNKQLIHVSNQSISRYSVDNSFNNSVKNIDIETIKQFFLTYIDNGYYRGHKHIFNSDNICILSFESKSEIIKNINTNKEEYKLKFIDLLNDIEINNIVSLNINYSIDNITDILKKINIFDKEKNQILIEFTEKLNKLHVDWDSLDTTQKIVDITNIWDNLNNETENIKTEIDKYITDISTDSEEQHILHDLIFNVAKTDKFDDLNNEKITENTNFKYIVCDLFNYIISKLMNSKITLPEFNNKMILPNKNISIPNIFRDVELYLNAKINSIDNLFIINYNDDEDILTNEQYKSILLYISNILNNFDSIKCIPGIDNNSFFTSIYANYLIQFIYFSTVLSILKIPEYMYPLPDGPDLNALNILEIKTSSYKIISIILKKILSLIKNDINRKDFTHKTMIEQIEKKREVEKEKTIKRVEEIKNKPEQYKVWQALSNCGLKSLFSEVESEVNVYVDDDNFEKEKKDFEKKQLMELGVIDDVDNEEYNISDNKGEDADYDI